MLTDSIVTSCEMGTGMSGFAGQVACRLACTVCQLLNSASATRWAWFMMWPWSCRTIACEGISMKTAVDRISTIAIADWHCTAHLSWNPFRRTSLSLWGQIVSPAACEHHIVNHRYHRKYSVQGCILCPGRVSVKQPDAKTCKERLPTRSFSLVRWSIQLRSPTVEAVSDNWEGFKKSRRRYRRGTSRLLRLHESVLPLSCYWVRTCSCAEPTPFNYHSGQAVSQADWAGSLNPTRPVLCVVDR